MAKVKVARNCSMAPRTLSGELGTDGTEIPYTIFKASMPIAPTTYELVIANDTNGSTGH